MSIRHCAAGGLVGAFLVLLAALVFSIASETVTDTEATEAVTPPPSIVLMVAGSHPNGLTLAWSDASGYRGSYELISDATGMAVATFPGGQHTGTVDGLTCGAVHRFWLVGGNRASNTIAGMTGPCE